MKKKNIILIYLSLLLFSSCRENCNDKLTVENDKIQYINEEIVTFENDTLGEINDTISLQLSDMSQSTYIPKDEEKDGDQAFCMGESILYYSNFFYIKIIQSPNESNNEILYSSGQAICVKDTNNYMSLKSYIDNEIEDVKYTYKNTEINAKHLFYNEDFLNNYVWNSELQKDSTYVYNDFYYTIDKEIKLLQYSTLYRNGTKRIWKLKE